MRKWEKAEIFSASISETEHKISLDFVYDGGYIGDGKFGWFGGSENCNPGNNPNPTPTPDPEPTPSTGDVTDQLS